MPWLSQVKGVFPNVLVGQPYSRSVVGVQLPGLFSSELWRCSSDLLRGGARPPRKEVVAFIDTHRERTTDGRRLRGRCCVDGSRGAWSPAPLRLRGWRSRWSGFRSSGCSRRPTWRPLGGGPRLHSHSASRI